MVIAGKTMHDGASVSVEPVNRVLGSKPFPNEFIDLIIYQSELA